MSNVLCSSDTIYLAIALLPNGKKVQLKYSDGSGDMKNKPFFLKQVLSGKYPDMKQFKPVVDNGINYVPYINDAGDAEGVCVQEGRMFKTTKIQFKFVPKTSQTPTLPTIPVQDPSQSSQVAGGRRRTRRRTRRNSKRMKKHRPKSRRHRRRTRKH